VSVVAPLCPNTSKNPPRPHPFHPRGDRRQPRKNRFNTIAPPHQPLPQFTSTARPPPASSSDRPSPPPPHPNPGIATRCQSHTSTRRSDQSRTDQGSSIRGEIAAGGHATPEGLPGAKIRARGAGRLTESHTRKPEKMPWQW
jgi:hypothetical protein